MATWKRITAVDNQGFNEATLLPNNPNQFKEVTLDSVKDALSAVVKDVVSKSGNDKITTDLKYLEVMEDFRVIYQDKKEQIVAYKTSSLTASKLNALADAIAAAPKKEYSDPVVK